jgi:hypothetical protein
MAVSSLLTSLEDFNGAPTIVGYGGGQGASVNSDVVIEGAQALGRRVDNTTNKGQGASFTAADLSAAGEHVKIWVNVLQWPVVTKVQIRISSGADDDHDVPTALFPALGGYIPIWIDVSRSPEVGGSANEASISEIGCLIDIGDVGGNAQNLLIDEIQHGTSGLRWDGTGGAFADFRTFEATNNEGNLVPSNGIDFVYSRLEIGSATLTTFTDSGFTLAFPDQALVAAAFMGLTLDVQNASTVITLSDGTIQSGDIAGATRRPDLIVSGTSGTVTLTNVSALGMRTIDLTSAVTAVGGIWEALNLTQANADLSGMTIRPNTAAGVALCDDPDFTNLSDISWAQAGAGHALEITTPGAYTFDAQFFEGFGGTGGSNLVANSGPNDAAVYNNSGGAVTISVTGGGDSPSVRNAAGSTTTVVNNTLITLTGLRDNTEVRVLEAADNQNELAGIEDAIAGTTDDRSFSFSLSAGTVVDIVILNVQYSLPPNDRISNFTIPSADTTLPISQVFDTNVDTS